MQENDRDDDFPPFEQVIGHTTRTQFPDGSINETVYRVISPPEGKEEWTDADQAAYVAEWKKKMEAKGGKVFTGDDLAEMAKRGDFSEIVGDGEDEP